MAFNITRQSFFPAFLTLAAVSIAAACRTANILPATAIDTPALPVSLPGDLVARFQLAYPLWARILAVLLLLRAGISIGRLTVRYNLYSFSTSLALPVFGFVATGFAAPGCWLTSATAVTLLALSVRHFARSYTNGYAFDALLRASLLLGTLPLLLPATLPLLLLLPFVLLRFRRTAREAAVALFGLLLPAATLCYLNWGAGGLLAAPIRETALRFAQGMPASLFLRLAPHHLALTGSILLLDLLALLRFFTDRYAGGMKARMVFFLTTVLFALETLLLCGGDASAATLPLLAVPSALLLPFLLVRLHRALATAIYALLAASALLNIILQ